MEKLNDHKYLELADEICVSYTRMCNNHCCGECRYAFLPNCKILFTLDYLEENTNTIEMILEPKRGNYRL